jgi:hypothetical protein
MNLITFDNVLSNPREYVRDMLEHGFQDFYDSEKTFHGMQPRGDDEFLKFVLSLFPGYEAKWNFARQSPEGQKEPNYIHKDDMMGEITVVLYLNEAHPKEDGTIIYDEENEPMCRVFSKFNRMVAFDSDAPHSRSLFDNFGKGEYARLVQVIFLSPIRLQA